MIYNDCIGALERESEGLLNGVLGLWGSDEFHLSESRIFADYADFADDWICSITR